MDVILNKLCAHPLKILFYILCYDNLLIILQSASPVKTSRKLGDRVHYGVCPRVE